MRLVLVLLALNSLVGADSYAGQISVREVLRCSAQDRSSDQELALVREGECSIELLQSVRFPSQSVEHCARFRTPGGKSLLVEALVDGTLARGNFADEAALADVSRSYLQYFPHELQVHLTLFDDDQPAGALADWLLFHGSWFPSVGLSGRLNRELPRGALPAVRFDDWSVTLWASLDGGFTVTCQRYLVRESADPGAR
jgi:hypothetical protein